MQITLPLVFHPLSKIGSPNNKEKEAEKEKRSESVDRVVMVILLFHSRVEGKRPEPRYAKSSPWGRIDAPSTAESPWLLSVKL